ncbi:hypothetical protein KDH_00740 [Dictyobacter sp. S3.2.2.5]|uniref:Uncharacterized protein n=2 Tax=Dictyobacter halimunensis TaxID=3026934 RepID=A0ABQ6FJ77_9CHLR|nr:hypothetical protein KDH_00740 [Dictyobacter sp. S3.2.2.5]
MIASVNVRCGEGITDAGEHFTFGAQASLRGVLSEWRSVEEGRKKERRVAVTHKSVL